MSNSIEIISPMIPVGLNPTSLLSPGPARKDNSEEEEISSKLEVQFLFEQFNDT
jgi:hypothetical protein